MIEGLCIKAAKKNPNILRFIPDHLKMQKKCNKAMHENPAAFFLVPDHFKTQELCKIAVRVEPWQLNDIPDYLKTQKMCDNVVQSDPSSLQFVPDRFVTEEQIDVWYYDNECCDDDELIEWYNGYQKRMDRKAKIKEELEFIAWHPNRLMN